MTRPYIFIEEAEELKKLWKEYDVASKEAMQAIPGSDSNPEKRAQWLEAERKQSIAIARIRQILGE